MNPLEAFLRSQLSPSLPGPLNALPAPVKQGLGVVGPLLPGVGTLLSPGGQIGMALAQRGMDADQAAAKALAGVLVGGMVGGQQAFYYAHHPQETPSPGDQAYINAFKALQSGHPIGANEAAAAEHPYLQGATGLVTDPLNLIGPAGKLAEAAKLGKLAEVLNVANRAQNLPFEAAGGALRAIAGRGTAPVAPELAGKLAQIAREVGAPEHGPDFQLPLPGTQARPPAPPVAIPPRPLPGVPRQLALGEQAVPAGEAAALQPAHPEVIQRAVAALEANAGTAEPTAAGATRFAPTERRPLALAPDAGRLDLAGTPYASTPRDIPQQISVSSEPSTPVTPGAGLPAPTAGEALASVAQDAPAGASGDLDRMDALRGQGAANNLAALLGFHYDTGATNALRYLTGGTYDQATKQILGGVGSLNAEGRVIANGRDVTRPLLDYLLQRTQDMDPALEARLKGAITGTPAAQAAQEAVPASMTPAERADWQARYVGQSQAGTDILAAGDKVGGSDQTQADLNALSPQDRMAALRKLAGAPTPPAMPAPSADLAPGTLPGAVPADNYRKALSTYTDRLYRESDIGEALAVLDPARNGDGGARDLYFSNTPDLALGQGANRGVLIEYDPATIQGTINQSKPAWPVAWQSGSAEFVDRLGQPNALNQAVRSVTVAPKIADTTPGMRLRLARTLDRLVTDGWTKTALPDGGARYVPPAVKPALGGGYADAAGGGGFGLLGMSPARAVGTLAGSATGGALGAGIGAATDSDNRLRGAAKGAAAGALIGGNVGAVVPSFSDSVDAALRIATNDLKLANTDSAGNLKLVAGNGTADILKQLNPFSGAAQRAEKKTFPGALPRNALGTVGNLLMNDHASGVPLMVRNIKAGLAQLPAVATDLEAAGRDPLAIAAAYQQLRSPTLLDLAGGDALREREILAAGGEAYHLQDLGQMNVPALTGAVKFGGAGLASPRGALLGPVTVATGLARGALAPAIGSMHRLGVGVVENGGRDAVVELATAAKLREAVPQILAAAQARGINPTALGPRIGEGIVAGSSGDAIFDRFYNNIFTRAAQDGGIEARATLGNYDRKTGLSAGVLKVAGVLFPGIDWNVEQAKILARGAAKHPLIAARVGQLSATPNPADPAHRGQVGIGGPVGGLLSGEPGGTFYVNPAYPFSPVGGELLNLPQELDPALHPGQSPYDVVRQVASAAGAGINPGIQEAAYALGATNTAPTSADRLLPAEQAADTALMRAVPGYNRAVFVNPLAATLGNANAALTGGQPTDMGETQTRIEQGRYVDPAVQRAAAALVLQQTHLPISAPANARFLADLGNPDSALYRAAEAHALGGQALGALANFVAPASGTGQTGTEAQRTAIESALQDPHNAFTQAALAQYGLPPGTAIPINAAQLEAYAATHGEADAARMQLVMDLLDRANPVLRVNVGTTDKERQALLQYQWEFQHQTGMRQAPAYMQAQEASYLQGAGLVPPGALAGQQRAQDLRTLPQNPLVPLGQRGLLGR